MSSIVFRFLLLKAFFRTVVQVNPWLFQHQNLALVLHTHIQHLDNVFFLVLYIYIYNNLDEISMCSLARLTGTWICMYGKKNKEHPEII